MNEMLGNQYFLARKYEEAKFEFENVHAEIPDNRFVNKKLIICYVQCNQIDQALILFKNFVEHDIQFIINSDPTKDDCPCPEIVKEILDSDLLLSHPIETKLKLAIVTLYIDANQSLKFFKEVATEPRWRPRLTSIIDRIKNYLKQIH